MGHQEDSTEQTGLTVTVCEGPCLLSHGNVRTANIASVPSVWCCFTVSLPSLSSLSSLPSFLVTRLETMGGITKRNFMIPGTDGQSVVFE